MLHDLQTYIEKDLRNYVIEMKEKAENTTRNHNENL